MHHPSFSGPMPRLYQLIRPQLWGPAAPAVTAPCADPAGRSRAARLVFFWRLGLHGEAGSADPCARPLGAQTFFRTRWGSPPGLRQGAAFPPTADAVGLRFRPLSRSVTVTPRPQPAIPSRGSFRLEEDRAVINADGPQQQRASSGRLPACAGRVPARGIPRRQSAKNPTRGCPAALLCPEGNFSERHGFAIIWS